MVVRVRVRDIVISSVATAINLVPLNSSAASGPPAFSCMDSPAMQFTAIPNKIHSDGKATKGETIVSISTVRAHPASSSDVIGFVYETYGGSLYYTPRSRLSYPTALQDGQVKLLKSLANAGVAMAVEPTELVRLNITAFIPVSSRELRQALESTGMIEKPCLSEPRTKSLPYG
jgi:hypothetical protein